jgi:hypothetical protein
MTIVPSVTEDATKVRLSNRKHKIVLNRPKIPALDLGPIEENEEVKLTGDLVLTSCKPDISSDPSTFAPHREAYETKALYLVLLPKPFLAKSIMYRAV